MVKLLNIIHFVLLFPSCIMVRQHFLLNGCILQYTDASIIAQNATKFFQCFIRDEGKNPTLKGLDLLAYLQITDIPRTIKIRTLLALCCFSLFLCVCVCARAQSLISDSLQPHGLQPNKLLCPSSFPGKNAGVGSHSLSPGDLPHPEIETGSSVDRFFPI